MIKTNLFKAWKIQPHILKPSKSNQASEIWIFFYSIKYILNLKKKKKDLNEKREKKILVWILPSFLYSSINPPNIIVCIFI